MELVVRATVMFFFLWLLTRVLGKRELAQMSAFEILLLVTFGDLVQQGVTQEDMSLTGAAISVTTIALWILFFAWITRRFPKTRKVIEGISVVIIRDGRIINTALKAERLTEDEVFEEARQNGIADLREIKLGILEATGKFSFITESGSRPPSSSN